MFQKIYICKSFLILHFIVFFIKIYLQNNYAYKNFYTFENRLVSTVVEREAIVNLKSNTKIVEIANMMPSIPRYYFGFKDFFVVLSKEKRSRLLIGK